MKIVCSKKILVNKIGIAQKGISAKTNLDTLKNLILEASGNELVITGYDLDLGVLASMEAEVETSGKVAINAKLFGEIVRKLPLDILSLEYISDGNKLLISSGKSTFQIVAGNLEDYPALPKITDGSSFKLSSKEFKSMINMTKMALSQDNTKPILTGALMEIDTNSVNMVSLDGYRLAVSKNSLDTGIGSLKKIIIPGRTLNDLSSALGSEELEIEFTVDEKYISAQFNGAKFISRLIEGTYIDYSKLLPAEYKTKIIVNRVEFLNAIDRATILAVHEKNSLVKFSITDEFIQATSNTDVGDLSEQVNITKEGESLNIAFNSRYLTEALKAMSSEEVSLSFTTSLNPCIIHPLDESDYLHLLLPIRLTSKM